MMESNFVGYPGYSSIQQQVVVPQFGGAVVVSALPKVLAFAGSETGNVFLYEVTKAIMLLVLPNGMELPSSSGFIKGPKPFQTPHGDKSGYVFYKNRPDHIIKLIEMFKGSEWQKELSEPLPPPTVVKEPILLAKKTICWEGKTFDFSLWEYSDKTLTIFVPIDITKGNDRLLKPQHSLICPDSPSGKANGYMCFKNNVMMINFVKSFIPDIAFETMYTKSIPLAAFEVKKQRDPQLLESKQFMSGDNQFVLDLVEYTEVSIALFPTPLFNLDGMQLTQNIIHPTQGSRPGYIIAKGNIQLVNTLKTYFGFSNIEDMYTITEESIRSIPQTKIINSSGSASQLADMSIKSFDDIPIETLVRILRTKLSESPDICSKELLGDKIIIYGNKENVNDKVSELDHLSTIIEITCGLKSLVILENSDI